ncbi:ABC transporter ATP-binding protein [Actinopolymorpha sp. B9G3]|uniref:ABC transporter ATP-binding protein n=1 Tax=Actinopolymorpha sp. B9G3 TaxID=3158970 RepID=UPI0032D8FB5D
MPRVAAFPLIRRYALHARYLWACGLGLCLLCVLLTLVSAGASAASLVTTGRLISALSGRESSAIAWTVATTVSLLLVPIASSILAFTSRLLSTRFTVMLCEATMEVGLHPYGIAHLEGPRTTGELETVGEAPRDWLFQAGIDAAWTLLAIRLGGIGAFVVLATWSWWAPCLLAGTWLLYSRAFSRWSSTIFDGLLELTGNDRRRASYLRDLLMGSAGAKEVRLFGLTGLLLTRHVTAWNNAQHLVWASRNSSVKGTLLVLVAPMAAGATILVALIVDVERGVVGAGLLVTLLQAVSAMAAFGPHTDPQTALAHTMSRISVLDRIRSEQGLPHLPRPARRPVTTAPRERPEEPVPAAIRLVDVAFTYPSAERPTLNGLNLEVPAGQSLALVGVNGAGKSTLIKLLCGLYRPDGGLIRVDGGDPGTDEAARRRLAVIFQDFVRYHLPLRDNVGVDLDQQVLERALRDAGGDEIVGRLEDGIETVLSAEYDGGTDLSGGQWQRIALARALAALGTGAGALVLDEPTAALDIRAEAALFDRFLAVARGATTMLVSHRLSSVRRAERIVVLADTGAGARIVEDGDHAELLRANGLYAELFTLQASRFAGQEVSR